MYPGHLRNLCMTYRAKVDQEKNWKNSIGYFKEAHPPHPPRPKPQRIQRDLYLEILTEPFMFFFYRVVLPTQLFFFFFTIPKAVNRPINYSSYFYGKKRRRSSRTIIFTSAFLNHYYIYRSRWRCGDNMSKGRTPIRSSKRASSDWRGDVGLNTIRFDSDKSISTYRYLPPVWELERDDDDDVEAKQVGFPPQADAGDKFDVEEEGEGQSRSFLSNGLFIFSSPVNQVSMFVLSKNAHNSNCDDGLESNWKIVCHPTDYIWVSLSQLTPNTSVTGGWGSKYAEVISEVFQQHVVPVVKLLVKLWQKCKLEVFFFPSCMYR